MPQKDLPGVTGDAWLALVYWGGLSAYCTGYANHDEYTVYLSLIGRVTAVKAVWAAFMDQQALTLPDETQIWRLPTDEETKYHTLNVRLPDTDWGHTVIVHSQATQSNLPDRLFYVLSESAEPPLRRFWSQWNRCLPYPSQPEWAAYLWQQGIRHQLITECQSLGTYCWPVKPDESWAEIIAGALVQEAGVDYGFLESLAREVVENTALPDLGEIFVSQSRQYEGGGWLTGRDGPGLKEEVTQALDQVDIDLAIKSPIGGEQLPLF